MLSCDSITKSFGSRLLFEDLSLGVSEGERLGLIGPNGSGKSTLIEILAGIEKPDKGVVSLRKGTRLGYVPQTSVFAPEKTVGEILQADAGAMVHVGKAGFRDPQQKAGELSGGWRKRLAIAAALVREPDILLMDEPTNHLDLEGILWLEKLLLSSRMPCLVISHDRYFLENVATRMAEMSREYPGGLFEAPGNYERFLEKKQEFLEAQSRQQETLANKVRRELEWLRRGPKARTGKSKARIDSAGRLIEELAEVSARTRKTAAQIDFTATDRRTKRFVVAEGIGKERAGRTLFAGLDLVLSPGLRLGLVGPNGSGKTTLLEILKGELDPDSGTVQRADLLKVVSFDQNREELDPELSLRRALCPEGDMVMYRGRPIHVAGWAKRFLFSSEQLELPVGRLSGGERARVFIARLMLREADVLLLDEPTNDLDIPTLETLEENLLEFAGALVLVTHDRYMLDRVSTAVLGLDGEGGAVLYADYSQWEQAQSERKKVRASPAAAPEPREASTAPKKKLSYLEQREWDQMEGRILEAEEALTARQRELEDPACFSDPVAMKQRYDRVQEAQAEVDRLYARWAEMEEKLG